MAEVTELRRQAHQVTVQAAAVAQLTPVTPVLLAAVEMVAQVLLVIFWEQQHTMQEVEVEVASQLSPVVVAMAEAELVPHIMVDREHRAHQVQQTPVAEVADQVADTMLMVVLGVPAL
jgi:hypothetical protein